MQKFFTVRNSLLAIGGLGTALLVWLTVSYWLGAQAQRSEAKRLLQSTEIEDLLLASAYNWAVERSLTHAALNLPDPASDGDRQGIGQHRKLGDSAFERALADLREFLGDAPQNAMAENAEDRFQRLRVLREQADSQLAKPKASRDRLLLETWFPEITGLIMAAHLLVSR